MLSGFVCNLKAKADQVRMLVEIGLTNTALVYKIVHKTKDMNERSRGRLAPAAVGQSSGFPHGCNESGVVSVLG